MNLPSVIQASYQADLAREWPNLSYIQKIAALRCQESLFNKYQQSERTTSSQDAVALAKFRAANSRCETYRLPADPLMLELMSTMRLRLFRAFGQYDHNKALEHWAFGPRASVGAKSNDWYAKVITPTSSSRYLRQALLPFVPPKVRPIILNSGFNTKESKLSFVPKNSESSRTICTEPSINMAHQKAVGGYLRHYLKRTGTDLSGQQSVNRLGAWVGSRFGTLATIDLSSASDTISLKLCEWLLPEALMGWMIRCRTEVTVTPSGEAIDLHMISSMGNDYTFPLQTILFREACFVVRDHLGLKSPVAVNGDDIIVGVEMYDLLCSLLVAMGFAVNATKSFAHGPFRESCGGDFWWGYPVRGVYIKTLTGKGAIYSAFNRVREWGRFHGINVFRTLLSLRRVLSRKKCNNHYVPAFLGHTAGFHCTQRQYGRSQKKYLVFRPREWCYKQFHSDTMLWIISSGTMLASSSHPHLPRIKPKVISGEWESSDIGRDGLCLFTCAFDAVSESAAYERPIWASDADCEKSFGLERPGE